MSLISEIRQDLDASALQLITEYRDRLFAEAVRLSADVSVAEDLVSRTLDKAIRNLESHHKDESVFGWMKTIMLNLHRNDVRNPVRRGTTPVDPSVLEEYSEADWKTDEEILKRSDSQALREAIGRLDPELKKAMVLHYLSELPVKQIAIVMNVPVGTVLWRLNIARKILARDLADKIGKKPLAVLLAALLGIGTLFGAWVSPLGDWVAEKVLGDAPVAQIEPVLPTPVTASVSVGEKAAVPNEATRVDKNPISETKNQEREDNVNTRARIQKTVATAACAAVVCAFGVSAAALPAEYREVEYIESTGTQYIDTKVPPKANTRVVLDFAFTEKPTAAAYFGWGASGGGEAFLFGAGANGWYVNISPDWKTTSNPDVPFDLERHVYDVASGSQKFDGTEYGTSAIGSTATATQYLYLFGGHVEWQTQLTYPVKARIYSCQIYEGDMLVRDFVPCYETKDGGVIGLYDLVGGTFYKNAGGGVFVKGNDVSSECLRIDGEPKSYGVVMPAYGVTNGIAVGASFVCTASESWTRADRRVIATCKGWTVYTNNVVYMEGTGNSFTYVHPDCETGARLVWDWDATYVTTKCYVSTDEAATPTYPYDSWETAARDLDTALAVDVDEIEVGDGTYEKTVEFYALTNAVKVYSSNGPAKTILKEGTTRGQVRITNAGASLSGFTIQGGKADLWANQGLVYMEAGVISNCVVTGMIIGSYCTACKLIGTSKMFDCDLDASGYSGGGWDSSWSMLWLEGNASAERCKVHGWSTTATMRDDLIGWSKTAVTLNSANAVLRNSLVYGNKHGTATTTGERLSGGGITLLNGTVENCTVADNLASGYGGGIYAPNATGKIVNCVVWGNTSTMSAGNDIYAPKFAAPNITYTCASDISKTTAVPAAAVGEGCTDLDPKLETAGGNPYALSEQSIACIDEGGETAASSAEGAIDLVGNPRLDWKNGIVDMGCYEFVPSHEAHPLSAVIDVKVSEGYGAKDVAFTVIPIGDCTDGLSWCWHFGDGQTDTESLSLTHRYQPGDYTAYLSLTNELGEATNVVCGTRLVIVPQTVYVAKEGTGTYPYDTWEKATNDLSVALALQSPEVVVGDGTFTNTVFEHVINHTVNLHSLNGSQKTTLRRSSASTGRHFTVGNNAMTAKTLISGFTLDGGYGGFNTYCFFSIGGGVISNCVIKGVIGNNYSDLCRISGSAKAFDCEFDASANASIYSPVNGPTGLLGISGDAVAERCVFHGFHSTSGNDASAHTRTAINVNGANAALRNSLVYDCSFSVPNPTTTNNVCGGGIRLENGTVANCTVVGCSCPAAYGGGIYAKNKTGKIVNCVVWGNTSGANLGNDIYAPLLNASNITYTCASDIGKVSVVPEAAVGEGCFAEDPLFRRPGKRDYRLRQHSPCLDAGDDSHYPDITAVRDLLGNPRKIYDHVDLGCYEMKLPGMLLIVR